MRKMLKQKRILSLILIAAMVLASAATVFADTQVTTTVSTPLYRNPEVTGAQYSTIPQGTPLTVISSSGVFFYVQYGGNYGYVMQNACSLNNNSTGSGVSYYLTTNSITSLYYSASTTAGTYTTIQSGQRLGVISSTGNFYYVNYNGYYGYVLMSACSNSSSNNGTGTATVRYSTPFYVSANSSGGYYGTLDSGDVVTTYSVSGEYTYAYISGRYGYVLTSALNTNNSTTISYYATTNTSAPLSNGTTTLATTIATIPSGASVGIISTTGSYKYVNYNGMYGYVLSSYFNNNNGNGNAAFYATTNAPATVYASASTTASVNTTIPSGVSVGIISTTGSFYYLYYNGYYGYVPSSYFNNGSGSNVSFYRTTNAAAPMYNSASTGASVNTTIPSGVSVGIISTSGSFYYLYYNGYYGYVPTSYFNSTGNNISFYVTTNSAAGLYNSASTSSSLYTTIPMGTSLGIISTSGTFYYTLYNGNYGYVLINACNSSTASTNTTVQYYLNALYATPLYSSANANSVSYSTISSGASVGVISKTYDGFYYVYANGSYGYVLQTALSGGTGTTSNLNAGVATYGTVAMGSTLYSTDSTTGTALGRVSNAGTVSIISQTTTGFYYVKVGNYTGYLQIAAVTVANDATVIPITDDQTYVPTTIPLVNTTAATTGVTAKKTGKIGNCVSWVSLRESADSSSTRLAKVTKDSTVTILDTEGSYTKVTYAGTTGYILNSYVV